MVSSIIDASTSGANLSEVCYLLHFDKPVCNGAIHYLGWTLDLKHRMVVHKQGRGSVLTRAAVAAGVAFRLARVWEPGSRSLERRLKTRGCFKVICPICQASWNQNPFATQQPLPTKYL